MSVPPLSWLAAAAAGGALGAVLRAAALQLARPGHRLPYATLAVNALGSFLIGGAMAAGGDPRWQAAVVGGALGGFTTYSTFAVEAARLYRTGRRQDAFLYIGVTLIGCTATAALGFAAAGAAIR